MADSSHLERMGRELKCPICLSLLNFAVSLTCNHVFCNSCIQKSMRSGSSCPVCKVPYQRREVRPAPHMDNLVNIYKGMEVALGVNIFVTQPEPANKLPDGEKQDEGANPCRPEAGEGFEQKDENRKTTSAAKSKRSSKSKLQNSGRNSAKPSFPTSKRVQPPKCPTSEHEKNEADNSLSAKCLPSARNRECPKGPEGLMLSPFFWLREEEDVEKSSQQTDLDHVTVTPLDAPRFSDIKDSDDDTSTKMSPKEEEVCSKPRDTVLFDSEMFEWTQRPCSPELCSSPVRMQVEARNEFDGVSDVGEILEHLDIFSHQEKSGLMDDAVPKNSCPGTKNGNGQNGNKRMRKSDRNTTKSRQKKRSKKDKDEADGTSSCDPKLLNNVMRHEQYDAKVGEDISKDEGVSKVTIEACNVSPGATLLCQDDATVVPESAPSCGIKAADEDDYLRKGRKTLKRLPQTHILNPRKSRKQKQNLADCCMSGPVFLCEKKRCKDEINASNLAEKSSSYTRQKTKKSRQELGSKTDQELCTKGFAPENLAHENEQLHPEFVTKVDDLNHDSSLKMDKFSLQDDKAVLRKCDTNSIKCAFCRSSEETEASGEMVHYLKGRPVSGNNDEESVIHAHKSCTEWAPNVYFEDDTVINLEVELARSRRIKCCLCGIKGAALGCYEKICRRSFHVPCAKILQECRWDTDNFVILCPLHISSKLPCEISTSQATRRKNNVKRKIQSQQTQVAAKQDKNTSLWNSRHSSEKLVLCCSALSAAEREHVSELAMLSGATVMKNWNSSVTHVIASVDENKACRRTLKVLMAILEGKWILNIEWVQACMKAMRYVDEDPYEIQVDIHGIKNGPRLGRLRLLNKGPKLFEGFKFYFAGDFEPSYKGYLHELITTAGGTVLHRKPIAESPASWTVIIYSVELPDSVTCHQNKRDMILRSRQSDAEALGRATGSKVTSNSWVLNCIAGHMLLDL